MREAAQNAPAVGRIILALGVAIGCTVCFGPGLAYAQTGTPEIKSKVVPSGERRQLAFLTSLNPDCSVNGETTVRLAKQASHGAVEIDRGLGYTDYGRRDLRYFCNLAAKEGYQINYTSNESFKGEDEFEIELFSPSGQYTVTRYSVTVK